MVCGGPKQENQVNCQLHQASNKEFQGFMKNMPNYSRLGGGRKMSRGIFIFNNEISCIEKSTKCHNLN